MEKQRETTGRDIEVGTASQQESFGSYLRSVRTAKGVSIRTLAKEVQRTPTYLSDIENGFNRPPDQKLLDEIVEALHLAEEPEKVHRLYDLAAAGRGDIPADIKTYLFENPDTITAIRKLRNMSNGNTIHKQIVAQIRSVQP